MFCKKSVFKNFAIFTGKHLCWSLFLLKFLFNSFIKNRLQDRCSPVNIAKFLWTSILENISERLFLYFPISRLHTLMNSNFVQLPVAVKRSIESTISARHSRKMIIFGIIFANRTSDSPAFKEHLHLRNGRVFLDVALRWNFWCGFETSF